MYFMIMESKYAWLGMSEITHMNC